MRFAYIDSQGKEVTIPSIDALRLRIELKAIVEDTMFHDANSGKWAPAREHEIFRALQRELQELEADGFSPPPDPPEPGAPAGGGEAPKDGSSPEAVAPAQEGAAGEGPVAPEDATVDEAAPDAGAGSVQEDDDFGLGMTLDLVPEDDMEPAVADLDETAASGPAREALEGLEDLELAGDWDAGGGEEAADPDAPAAPGEAAAPHPPVVPDEPAGPAPASGPGEEPDVGAGPPPERFAMSPQDDLLGSVPDPGLADAGEPEDDTGADEGGMADDLALEPGLAESFESDALNAGTAASDELELESPLTDYDADMPPAWMQTGEEEPADVGGTVAGAGLAGAGAPAPVEDRDVPPMDGRDVPPPMDRGEPPPRPGPRPRSAPPQRKLRKASTPGVGRLVGLVAVVVAVGAGGWYGFQAFAGGGGEAGAEARVSLPPIPSELLPQMRQYAAAAVSRMVATVGDLPEREAIPPRPDPDWLAGNYLAGASAFDGVPAYWNAVLDYLDAAEAAAPEAFRNALDQEIAGANLTEGNAALIRERAVAGWEAAAPDRQLVFDQLRAVGVAAVDLHQFVVANEDGIAYEPAAGGVSRDPVLEAVPATEELGDAMWDRVGDITRALDNLGYLETVTTDGLLQTFLDKLEATPVR